jgi:hypothetical protein
VIVIEEAGLGGAVLMGKRGPLEEEREEGQQQHTEAREVRFHRPGGRIGPMQSICNLF